MLLNFRIKNTAHLILAMKKMHFCCLLFNKENIFFSFMACVTKRFLLESSEL